MVKAKPSKTPKRLAFPRKTTGQAALLFAKSSIGLHAMVTTAGYEIQTSPSYDWHGLRRGNAEFTLFQYTLSGGGMLNYEGRIHAIKPGQLLLLHFPHDNRYWLEKGSRWEFFWICLNGAQVLRAWRTATAHLGPIIDLPPQSALIQTATDICLKTLEHKIQSPWQASSLAYELSMRLLDEALPWNPQLRRLPRSPAIARAIDYCRTHLHQSIHIEALAEHVGYSRFHFSRLFAKSEGITPEQYLIQQRTNLAAKFLQTTDDPIKVIAARSGYKDVAYFCRVFKKTMGLTPGEFRNSGMYRTQHSQRSVATI